MGNLWAAGAHRLVSSAAVIAIAATIGITGSTAALATPYVAASSDVQAVAPASPGAAGPDPTIELAGELRVTITEGAPLDGHVTSTADHEAVEKYSVLTDGVLVKVAGEIPAGAASGSTIRVDASVPPVVVAAVSQATKDALDSSATVPLVTNGAAAKETAAAAAALDVALPISRAAVLAAQPAPASPMAHQYYVAIPAPVGVAPLAYTDAQITDVLTTSSTFWANASRGLIPSFSQVGGLLRYASAFPCAVSPEKRWQEAAQQHGFTSASSFFAGTGLHLIVLLPPACATDAGIGVATVGASLNEGGLSQVTLASRVDRPAAAHEWGHNLSLDHSNVDLCASATCTELEYGDVYDVMGVAIAQNENLNALNSRSQLALGFLPESNTASLVLAAGTQSTRATYELQALDSSATAAGVMIVRVTDPESGLPLAIEYRSGAGQDASAFYRQGLTVAVTNTKMSTGSGVRVLRSDPGNGSSVISWVPTPSAPYALAARLGGPAFRTSSDSVRVAVDASTPTSATITVTLTTPATLPVYRFWSPTNRAHFFTINPAERDQILATYPTDVWTYEGIAYQAFPTQVTGTVPLYRFYSDRLKGHFFTANDAERRQVIATYPGTWGFEGIAYYVYPLTSTVAGSKPVFRFWSPDNQHHFFTADPAERDQVLSRYPANIWTFEGDAFKVPAG